MSDLFHSFLAQALAGAFPAMTEEVAAIVASKFERVSLASGHVLYRQGDPADSLHIVVTGRLRVEIPDGTGRSRVVRQLATGDPMGEIALLTGTPRTATIRAIRDTILGRLSKERFDDLARRYPRVALDMARNTIRQLTETEAGAVESPSTRNIALVALDPDVPLGELGRRLELALLRHGTTRYFDRRIVANQLGLGEDERIEAATEGLDTLLDQAESSRRFVIYQADPQLTTWTRKCLSQADRVLLVAYGSSSPIKRRLEEEIDASAGDRTLAERDLVLLHGEGTTLPAGTADWLAARQVDRHYHLPWRGEAGFRRLARIFADRAVTVVLGGGGARGFSHIGAIRALREAGVPIDAIGGASIGSMIACIVALGWGDETILTTAKKAFVDDEPLNDYTLPIFALLEGKKLSRSLEGYLGTTDIVDTWIPYFCVSTNLSASATHVHHQGLLWKALRSSVSLPAILPPVVEDGELLIDGGALDNLPIDVMHEWMPGRLVAIDPGVEREFHVSAEEAPSALDYLSGRVFGLAAGDRFPTLGDVIIKSTLLGGSQSEAAIRTQVDLYLNPPLERFGLLDWARFYDIVETGYRYTREHLPAWLEANPDVVERTVELRRA